MTALKCVFEVVVKENARERLGQNRLKRSYLGEEALHVDWRVFPVQPQFDGDLGDLADDADNAYNPERVGHTVCTSVCGSPMSLRDQLVGDEGHDLSIVRQSLGVMVWLTRHASKTADTI